MSVSPSYAQKTFTNTDKQGKLCLVASPDGAQGSVSLHADASLYASLLDTGQTAKLVLPPGRKAYLWVARGLRTVNGTALGKGDAAMLSDEPCVTLADAADAEVLLFDLSA